MHRLENRQSFGRFESLRKHRERSRRSHALSRQRTLKPVGSSFSVTKGTTVAGKYFFSVISRMVVSPMVSQINSCVLRLIDAGYQCQCDKGLADLAVIVCQEFVNVCDSTICCIRDRYS